MNSYNIDLSNLNKKDISKIFSLHKLSPKLSKLKNVEVNIKAGVLKEKNPIYPKRGLPVSQIALYNEVGVISTNKGSSIPARPFLKKTAVENRNIIKDYFKGEFLKEYSMKDIKLISTKIGMKLKREIKKNITAWKTPKNSPYTIKKKGFNNPLIETGLLRKSINYKVDIKKESG